ncbi:allantoinase AllB [Acidothermaceae bacterium B102]|nr:allantoinase AllB [Acidothermaceae bacterium B102]
MGDPVTWCLRSTSVVVPGEVRAATLVITDGRIADVVGLHDAPDGVPVVDVGDLTVSPGIVDSHVHVNEPGRTHWEGFATATRAAAAGGVTTLVDMPLNSVPPTTTVEALQLKRSAAVDQVHVDVAFWGGVTSTDVSSVTALVDEGVCGFKVFLVPSGVDEYGWVDAAGLHAALSASGDLPVLVHAEAPGPLDAAPAPDGRSYPAYLASRPDEAEVVALEMVLAGLRATGGRAHVLHLSSAQGLGVLDQARNEGLRISVETCPHYLSLAAEDIPDGATQTKCAPPVRGRANRELLWEALGSGQIDLVASDHSPAPPSVKALDSGDFGAAWGGIAGVQTALSVVWTEAWSRGFGLTDVARWQSERPAAMAGLPGKGAIAVGNDADLVVWDPWARHVVDAGALAQRHPVSPWHGRTLRGVVHTTYLRGEAVDSSGPARGRLLRRGERA